MNISYSDIDWTMPGVKKSRVENGLLGAWVVCVMDSVVVRNLLLDASFADILLEATKFEDVSSAVDKFLVKITTKDNKTVKLLCDEMLYSILLSNPVLVKIDPEIHKHYQLITVGWPYIDGDFIVPGEIE
jgi:hypothetical protein